MQYFRNEMYNSVASDAFTELVEVTKYTGLRSPNTLWGLFSEFAPIAWGLNSESTFLGLSDIVLVV